MGEYDVIVLATPRWVPGVILYSDPADLINTDSIVVAVYNITAEVGSDTVLTCQSGRMVWTQDSLSDRQRVAHWDVFQMYDDYRVERIFDMFSAGDQRVYNSYNKGRMSMNQDAFSNGNFSLTISDVRMSDKGVYSCNLHHHYCHLHESVKVQLSVTKTVRKAKIYWDGEKVVIVALAGTNVILPCVNRKPIWIEHHLEEEQQVVHWDRQPPGVSHDRADRLIDLYASGERRSYGPTFIRRKMNISDSAFREGDFSLSITDLVRADEGIYSCHLHHHYCGLHERRIFKVKITEPVKTNTKTEQVNLTSTAPNMEPKVVEVPKVINVIIPENRAHFFQQLGYILATLVLLLLLITVTFLLTRRRRRRGHEYDVKKSEEKIHLDEFVVSTCELKESNNEDVRLDYKNNILKEKAELSKTVPAKNIDLDKDFKKEHWK
ncbi:matrix remodeling-associated protein 8 [Protopterus annectens]|uniref:matrix remodeling-associated protein 8 n=1 Tax=Protopterus annectens TaxID=7888 RepID=UPI001CFA25D7|nr:matrix remodeling-associated protein 8 [Protopterus annectens]